MPGPGDMGRSGDLQDSGKQDQAKRRLSDEGRRRREALQQPRSVRRVGRIADTAPSNESEKHADAAKAKTTDSVKGQDVRSGDDRLSKGELARTYVGDRGHDLIPKENDGYLTFRKVAGSVVGPRGTHRGPSDDAVGVRHPQGPRQEVQEVTFWDSIRGHQFVDITVPNLVKALNKHSEAMKELTEELKKQREERDGREDRD